MRPRRSRSKRSRSAPISFEAHSFEYLRTGEAEVLLRLEGSWSAGREQAVPGAELRLSRGDDWITLAPLPDPRNFPVAASPRGEAWRAAFPASADEAADESSRFFLCLSDGTTFDLPRPVDHDAAPAPEPEPAPKPEPTPEPAREPQPAPVASLPEADRIKAIIAESIERFGVLEDRIESEREARAEAEHRLEEALANVKAMEAQLESTTRELEQAWVEVEERQGVPTAEVAELRAELDKARADAAKLQSVLDVANAARKAAEDQLAASEAGEPELREQLEINVREVTVLRAQLEEKDERLSELEAALEDARPFEERVHVLEDQLADAQRVAARVEELEQAIAQSGNASSEAVAELEMKLQAARNAAVQRAADLEDKIAEVENLKGRVDELQAALAESDQRTAGVSATEQELRDALATAKAEARKFEERFGEADRASEELARRAREAEEAAAESAEALEAAVGERARVEARVGQLEAELAETKQIASSEAMAREEAERRLESGEGITDEVLKQELSKAREDAARERGQRASFEKELKRRDNSEFELGKKVESLEAELAAAQRELASRNKAIAEMQRSVEETRSALEAAEASTAEARVARERLERDLREVSESGDDADTALARHKAEMAELRRELEESMEREHTARRRIQELERGLAESDEDAQLQQILGEVDRLRAALGQATTVGQNEMRRRQELEEELQSRVVAEERLRAMLQAKGSVGPVADGDDEAAEIEIPVMPAGVTATDQGNFLERLAAAKKQAETVERPTA